MKHTLPKLPYKELPGLSEKQLATHHGKHHKKYVENLNKLIPNTEFEDMKLEDIVKKSSGTIFNNAAQHWNHSFLWQCMTPEEGMDPSSELVEAIEEEFDTFERFKNKFIDKASSVFGSGWVSLTARDDRLSIITHKDAASPIIIGRNPNPLLIVDVWEHAYYIDYLNDRPEYLEKFWDIINWEFVSDNYKK